MFDEGIKIEWSYGHEYIKLNLHELPPSTEITSTIQVWKEGGATQYNVVSEIRCDGDSFEIVLTYDRENNTEIEDELGYWGRSTIVIPAGSEEGVATWVGTETKKYDGQAKVTKLPSGLTVTGPIPRQTVSRIQREQQQLRAALLLLDKACAITSESFADLLDAAHIIAAKRGGREIIENAILLRTDVHRLLDSGAISINKDGNVNILKELSSDYQELLLNKRIAPIVHERISKALEHVANAI